MAIFTILKKIDISRILKNYHDFSRLPFSYQGIAMGTVNTYYRLRFRDGRVLFLKIDEIGKPQRLKNELAILHRLDQHSSSLGFMTPCPLSTIHGKDTVRWGKKFVLLFPCIPGKIIFEEHLQRKHLWQTGQALAKLHTLRLNPDIKAHRFDMSGLRAVYQQIGRQLRLRLPEVEALVAQRLHSLENSAPKRFRTVLIHADLFAENMHWQRGRLVGILDFEAGGRGAALFDIAVALHALCYQKNRFISQRVKSLLDGYQSVIPLSAKDQHQLPIFLQITALRFLLTRLRDFELAGPVKAEPFKDFRDFLQIRSLPPKIF